MKTRTKNTLSSVVGIFAAISISACEADSNDRPSSQSILDENSDPTSSIQEDGCTDSSSGSTEASADCSSQSGEASAEPDQTPLWAQVYSSSAMELFWHRDTDDNGPRQYDIYRNGSYVFSSNGTSYFDQGLVGGEQYDYSVYPITADGVQHAAWTVSLVTLSATETVGTTIDPDTTVAESSDPDASQDPAPEPAAAPTTDEDAEPTDPEQSPGDAMVDQDNDEFDESESSSSSASNSSGFGDSELTQRSLSAQFDNNTLTLRWTAETDEGPVQLFDIVASGSVLLARTTSREWSMPLSPENDTILITVYAIIDDIRTPVGRTTVNGGVLSRSQTVTDREWTDYSLQRSRREASRQLPRPERRIERQRSTR